jgi:hypothetical protein
MAMQFNSHEELLRQNLDDEFKNVENKNKELETKQIISTNRLRKMKMNILREVFDSLEELGVNPNDIESIGKFLERLRRQDPDLVEMFEFVFNDLVSSLEGGGMVEGALNKAGLSPSPTGHAVPAPTPQGPMEAEALPEADVEKFSDLSSMMPQQ